MSIFASIVKEVLGLFVDDGSLALAILVWVGAIATTTYLVPIDGAPLGALLFAGLIVILVENVFRRARSR